VAHDGQEIALGAIGRPGRLFRLAALRERAAQLELELLALLYLVLEGARPLLENAYLDHARGVVSSHVALSGDHSRVLVQDPPKVFGVGLPVEVRHLVGAEQRERMRAGERVPQLLEPYGAGRIAILPEQVDHLAVHAHRGVDARGKAGLDHLADDRAEALSVGHQAVHEHRERIARIGQHQAAVANRELWIQATARQLARQGVAVRRSGYDDQRLALREARFQEISNGASKEAGVLVELDGVIAVASTIPAAIGRGWERDGCGAL
jgi:hypothetical protein